MVYREQKDTGSHTILRTAGVARAYYWQASIRLPCSFARVRAIIHEANCTAEAAR